MVGVNYRLTHDMKEAAAALQLPLASTAMILRQIYADALGQGAVVWQLGARAREVALEVDRLFREILPHAVEKRLPLKRPTVKRYPTRGKSERIAAANRRSELRQGIQGRIDNPSRSASYSNSKAPYSSEGPWLTICLAKYGFFLPCSVPPPIVAKCKKW